MTFITRHRVINFKNDNLFIGFLVLWGALVFKSSFFIHEGKVSKKKVNITSNKKGLLVQNGSKRVSLWFLF